MISIRPDAVLRDVTGHSGRDIITAVLSGGRNAQRLAGPVQPGVKAPREETAEVLSGDWRGEYIFEPGQCYEICEYYHQKMAECDRGMEKPIREETERKRKDEEKEEEKKENGNRDAKETEKVKIKKKPASICSNYSHR